MKRLMRSDSQGGTATGPPALSPIPARRSPDPGTSYQHTRRTTTETTCFMMLWIMHATGLVVEQPRR